MVLVFVLTFALTVALSAASIPLGLYTAAFTHLPPGGGAGTPVSLYLWIGPVLVSLPVTAPIGALFAFLEVAYVLLFLAALRGGAPLASALSGGLKRGFEPLLSNDLVVAVVSIGFLAFTATAVDGIVSLGGVPVGGLNAPDLYLFASAATAPLVEEFGFRLCIVGLIAALVAAGRPNAGTLHILWRPAAAYEGEAVFTGKAVAVWAAVAGSSVVFGLAHVASGSGWEVGKLPEAVYGGLVLGYLYAKKGIHIAILAHWGLDYLGSAFAFFGEGAFGIPWTSEPGYFLQQVATADLLVGVGLVSTIIVVYLGAKRLLGVRRAPASAPPPSS